ncbi:MAG: M4 family metallopeptidase [Chryseobacterium sp.]|jgi:Zn-dependent metalloprotease|uniref:M4 family metallopeptidase n=1 Tax=Chryseobacterium sp. TaxID=1871047 RepID=UPI0028228A8B|nr:M4 family metallopeptidase [Chryseobacterium sp.]MDR2236131.1 M4 family metallopeptidase [Chryseobacterium sp.]
MKKITILVKVLTVSMTMGTVSCVLTHAQNKEKPELSVRDFPKFSVTSPMGTFNAFFNGQNIPSDFLISHLGEWLGGDSSHTFQLLKSETDELGIKHSVYQHYFKGTKVMDDIVSIHEKNGMITYINGEFIRDITANVSSALSVQDAKSIISATVDLPVEEIIFGEAENVMAKVYDGRGIRLYSTIMIGASSLKSLFSKVYYIDHSTQKIVKELSQLHHVDTPSTSATYYKGNQSVTVDSYNGGYRLMDNARKIRTMNATGITGSIGVDPNGYIILAGATEYTNTTANFTAAETKAPVEVHWAIKSSYDYYLNKFNRNSFDGNGAAISSYYNMDFSKLNPSLPAGYGFNATAVKLSNGMQFMAFGNGNLPSSPGATNTMAAIDVGGHEYSHMIIDRNGTGGLNYQSESGALNESFADILGTSIEFYGAPSSANWTMGEGILNVAPGYLRSMSNPNSANSAIGKQPDTYSGTYWASTANPTADNDHGGVHTNSGVGNYWFYLLSQGGSGTNDIGNLYDVTGITLAKAEKIAYKTLTTYLTPNSTYMDAYNATKQAVTDLYGASGNEQLQNVKAWYGVGIGTGVLATHESARPEEQFNIYPNPVKNGVFTIENPKNEVTIEVYDTAGRKINETEKLKKGSHKINMNTSQKGVYLLKIISNGEQISSKKLIVE